MSPAYIPFRQCDEQIFECQTPHPLRAWLIIKSENLSFYLLSELSDFVLDIQTAESVMRLTEEYCVGARCVGLKSWWRLVLVWECVCVIPVWILCSYYKTLKWYSVKQDWTAVLVITAVLWENKLILYCWVTSPLLWTFWIQHAS